MVMMMTIGGNAFVWVRLRLSTAPCVSSDTQAAVQLCFPLIVTPVPKRRGSLSPALFMYCAAQEKWVREMAALLLWSQRRGTLRKHGADNDVLVFTALSCSSSVASWLRPPEEHRCDCCWAWSWVLYRHLCGCCIEGFPVTTPNHSFVFGGFWSRYPLFYCHTTMDSLCIVFFFPFFFPSSIISYNCNHTVLLTIPSDCLPMQNKGFAAQLKLFRPVLDEIANTNILGYSSWVW